MLSNKALVTQATKTGYYAGVNIITPVLFQAWIDGNSGVAGTVELYGSNDQRALQTPDIAAAQKLSTITFVGSGTGPLAPPESFVIPVELPYGYFFARITAISGTNAAISVIAGT